MSGWDDTLQRVWKRNEDGKPSLFPISPPAVCPYCAFVDSVACLYFESRSNLVSVKSRPGLAFTESVGV
jgi:hypothetical protein